MQKPIEITAYRQRPNQALPQGSNQALPQGSNQEDGYLSPSSSTGSPKYTENLNNSFPRREKYVDSGVDLDIPLQNMDHSMHSKHQVLPTYPHPPAYHHDNRHGRPTNYDNRARPDSLALKGNHYDYADPYEELPQGGRAPAPPPLRNMPSMNDTSDTSEGSRVELVKNISVIHNNNNNTNVRKYKKKQNPIYEAAETTLKEKDYNEKHWKRVRRHTRMAVILFIFLFVIAIAALIISIFGGIIQVSGSDTPTTQAQTGAENITTTMSPETILLQNAIATINELKSNFSSLMKDHTELQAKYTRLEKILHAAPEDSNATLVAKVASNTEAMEHLQYNASQQHNEIQLLSMKLENLELSTSDNLSSIETSLNNKTSTLEDQAQQLFTAIVNNLQTHHTDINDLKSNLSIYNSDMQTLISSMNFSIFNQIDAVTKMQGPRGYNGSQGPPGVGDLTQCRKIERSSSSDPSSTSTVVAPFPPDSDFENWVVLGVTCSVTYGTMQNFETQVSSSGNTQFVCKCGGSTEQRNRQCTTHVWQCPKIS